MKMSQPFFSAYFAVLRSACGVGMLDAKLIFQRVILFYIRQQPVFLLKPYNYVD